MGRVPSLRTNLAEATAIDEEVYSRLRDPERRKRRADDPEKKVESFIVVTFNVQQRKLITELFRATDPVLYGKQLRKRGLTKTAKRLSHRNLRFETLKMCRAMKQRR